jgi:DNA polymerase-1
MPGVVHHSVDLEQFADAAERNGCYSFDIEHPPDLAFHRKGFRLSGISFATGIGDNAEIAFYETRKPEYTWLMRRLAASDAEAIAFNGKYDLQGLVADGVLTPYEYPAKFVDPMIATNLLDDNRRPNELGLKKIMLDGFGIKMSDYTTAWSFGEDSKEFADYATDDAIQEFFIWKFLRPKLEAEKLFPIFCKILMPASKLFADMESEGVCWDITGARRLLVGFQKLRDTMKQEIFNEIGPLNLNSGDQLANRLFNELGYDTTGVPMTDSGKRLKVDTAVMDDLAAKYPICDKIRTFRTADKMINTYVEPITRRALEDDRHRVHCTYWLVSSTGRTRCEKPNFQNVPAWLHKRPGFEDLNIRNSIIAAPGRKLVVSDLSQIELRICAHTTQDPLFLKAYLDWTCGACKTTGQSKVILHSCPNCGAAENEKLLKNPTLPAFWHGLDLHQITTDNIPALGGNRQNGKTSNFALIYLASARRMNMQYPELSIRQWQEVINGFFDTYKGVRTWHIRMEQALKTSGIGTDIFGRRRRILKSDIAKSFKHALNMYVNFPIQSSAGSLIQLSMVKMRQKWIESGEWLTTIFPSIFCHDEVVFEAVEEHAERFSLEMQEIMENSVQLRVPIRTDPKIVDAWGHIKA